MRWVSFSTMRPAKHMLNHDNIDDVALRRLIRRAVVTCAGNRRLGIFGVLSCTSGKRMSRSSRVFFTNTEEAERQGYRPCGHCMKSQYKQWKKRYVNDRHRARRGVDK